MNENKQIKDVWITVKPAGYRSDYDFYKSLIMSFRTPDPKHAVIKYLKHCAPDVPYKFLDHLSGTFKENQIWVEFKSELEVHRALFDLHFTN
jgi:hypothetical protein